MKRQAEETYFEYLKRATESVRDGIVGYDEYGQSLLGGNNTYAGENWRKFYYIISKVLPLIENDIEFEVSEESRLRQLELKEKDAYKAAVRLRDQKRELRKWHTSEARYEHLVDVVKESLEGIDVETEKYGAYIDLNTRCQSATLMLSDWHAGALVDNQFNFYNLEVLQERAKQIFEKTIAYSILHSVRDIYIEINGDMIHGLINVSNRVQAEEDVATQVIKVSKILANLINGLKPYFGKITVITTLGNHGRMHQDKTACVTQENFEKLTTEFLRLRLADDIPVIAAQAEDFTKYEIEDKTICVAHGHNDKLGTVVKDFCVIYNKVPDEIHLGHTHAFKDINDCDVMVTVNGSLQGTDDYALTLRRVTKPSQTLIIYGEDRCAYNFIVD